MTIAGLSRFALAISGLVLTTIGGFMLLHPAALFDLNGIQIGSSPGLLSEIRAPGGALLASGVLVLSGIFVRMLKNTALFLSALLFLSYGTSRIVSMLIDGAPPEALVGATILELAIGTGCAALLAASKEVSLTSIVAH